MSLAAEQHFDRADAAVTKDHSIVDKFMKELQTGQPTAAQKPESDPMKVLGNAKSSEQDKLKAAEQLYAQGKREIEFPDIYGTTRHLRLEVQKSGDKKLIHVFEEDKNGKDHIALRGVDKGNGQIAHETDRKGNGVSFVGDWWNKNQKSSLNGQTDSKPADTKPPSDVKPAPPETKPAPPETKPAPPETKPAPPETKPAPPETKPTPPETKPAPPETKPAPPETKPAPPETKPAPSEQTKPTDAGKPASPEQALNPFADRIHLGKIDGKDHMPDSVVIDQTGKAPMNFVRVPGHDYYVDSNGARYHINFDAQKGELNASSINGTEPSYSWSKNGNQTKETTEKDGTKSTRLDGPTGEKESEVKMDKHGLMLNLEIRQADGSMLSLRDGHGWSSGSMYHQDGYGPEYKASLKGGTITLQRIGKGGIPVETTTVLPNGDSMVVSNNAEGVPLCATQAKVNGRTYTHTPDGHWVDSKSGKQVDVAIKKNGIEVKS